MIDISSCVGHAGSAAATHICRWICVPAKLRLQNQAAGGARPVWSTSPAGRGEPSPCARSALVCHHQAALCVLKNTAWNLLRISFFLEQIPWCWANRTPKCGYLGGRVFLRGLWCSGPSFNFRSNPQLLAEHFRLVNPVSFFLVAGPFCVAGSVLCCLLGGPRAVI